MASDLRALALDRRLVQIPTQQIRRVPVRREIRVEDAALHGRRTGQPAQVIAVPQSSGRLDQAERSVVLAKELARAETVQVQAGESDLFRLNLREQQVGAASEAYIKVIVEYFRSLARYRAALGQVEDEPPRADR